MSKYVSLDGLKWATTELKSSCNGLVVDFLILKRGGLTEATPTVITTKSTEPSAKRLMGIFDTAGNPPDKLHVFFNPFVHGWRHDEYPRSGTYSTLDRSKTFADIVKIEKPDLGMQVSLRPDYVPAAKNALRKAKGKPPAIPIEALALWVYRYDELLEIEDAASLTQKLVSEFGLSQAELDGLFTHVALPPDVFSNVPLDKKAFTAFLFDIAPDEGKADLGSDETTAEELPEDLLEFLRGDLLLPEGLLRQLVTLLRAGKHVILTGPPGTGKSTLARQLALVSQRFANAFAFPGSAGHAFTTATADWSTFDTLGGYMPSQTGSGLKFQEGLFLQAISENKWLVIDELNRADVDKAFGQMFTVLSGHSVITPFKEKNQNISIAFDRNERKSSFDSKTSTYTVGQDWRIIATMNTFDRNLLFQLSAAFVRRFAVVHVGIPTNAELVSWLSDRDITAAEKQALAKLISILGPIRPLGPAIWKDVADYLEMRSQHSFGTGDQASKEAAFTEAVIAYILPQLDGVDRESLTVIEGQLLDVLAAEVEKEQLRRTFREMF